VCHWDCKFATAEDVVDISESSFRQTDRMLPSLIGSIVRHAQIGDFSKTAAIFAKVRCGRRWCCAVSLRAGAQWFCSQEQCCALIWTKMRNGNRRFGGSCGSLARPRGGSNEPVHSMQDEMIGPRPAAQFLNQLLCPESSAKKDSPDYSSDSNHDQFIQKGRKIPSRPETIQ